MQVRHKIHTCIYKQSIKQHIQTKQTCIASLCTTSKVPSAMNMPGHALGRNGWHTAGASSASRASAANDTKTYCVIACNEPCPYAVCAASYIYMAYVYVCVVNGHTCNNIADTQHSLILQQL